MSDGLTARLKSSLKQRVDCSAVLTAPWATLTADELAMRTVELEREGRVPLGDLFEVRGSPAGRVRFTGDLSRVDRLAAGLSEGTVTVEGNLGDEAGLGMAAGALVIEGNAGARTGAAAPGFKRGMTGGELIVRGSAGAEAGASMRRGLLVIGGSSRRACRAQHDRRQYRRLWGRWCRCRTLVQARLHCRAGRHHPSGHVCVRLHLSADPPQSDASAVADDIRNTDSQATAGRALSPIQWRFRGAGQGRDSRMDGDMTTLELHTGSLRMNEVAHEIADGMADQAEALRVRTFRLPGGARVIDAGVEVDGGIEAGLALAEICMGGLGSVTMSPVQIGGESHPGVLVWTDHPAISCMASQYAGWAVSVGKFFAMGSGPLRAHARVERELFEKLGYEERRRRRRAGAGGPRASHR